MDENEGNIDTRSLSESIQTILRNVAEASEDFSLEEMVEVGNLLWEVSDEIKSILEPLKKAIREEALSRLGGQPGMSKIEGSEDGQAQVRVPNPSLRLRKGVNDRELRDALGADFSLFFEEVTTLKPRKEFEERVMGLDNKLHQKVLHNAVEQLEPTPRVSFRRKD